MAADVDEVGKMPSTESETVVEVIGALEGLLTAATQATEASGVGGVGPVVGMMPEAERLVAHGRWRRRESRPRARGAGGGPSNT